ncbi:hypothetical protein H4R27_006203 [Coemansia aciculifera]|nr:hypothetical protein H4R27_006203 [Coemansia aciculifera]
MTAITENSLTATAVVADEAVVMHSTKAKETSNSVETPDVVSSVTEKKDVADTVAEISDESPEVEEEIEPAEVAVAAIEASIDIVAPVVVTEATVAVVVSEEAQQSEPEPEQQVADVDTDASDASVREPVENGAQNENAAAAAAADTVKSNDTSQDDQPDSDTEQPPPDNSKPSGGNDSVNKRDSKEEDDSANQSDGKGDDDDDKPNEEESKEVQIERPRVQVYGSTVSGNRIYKRQAKELFTMLEAQEVDFEFICIAADELAKKYLRRKALGNMTIPQVYVDGELRGFYDDAFKANEADELYEWLGLDEEPVDY